MMRMIGRNAILLGVLLLLLALAAACAPAPAPAPVQAAALPSPTPLPLPGPLTSSGSSSSTAAAPAAPASAEVIGASLYQLSCAACHGNDRGGNTFEMDGQKIEVPALAWSDLSSMYATDPGRGTVAEQLAVTITKGQDETGGDLNAMMPRWSSLSQTQVSSLVDYIQNPGSATGEIPADLQGEQLYQAACAACHGADGAGETFDVDGNKIDTPSLHWGDLTQTYSADPSRGTVDEQVALGITKGQDETGGDLNAMMPRWSSLSKEQVDSLVQYLQTQFK